MRRLTLLIALLSSIAFYSQKVNDYRYAMVPSKFDFQRSTDQYNLNTYTKMFMQKYGFETFLDNETIPVEIANSNCDKVFVDVIDDSGLRLTKLTVILKDCTNKVLFTSSQGMSREKDYKVAYVQALRQAFSSFDNLHYKYIKKKDSPAVERATEINTNISTSITSATRMNIENLPNGFQVVDGKNIVLRAWATEIPNTFIAKKGDVNGILFKKSETWYFQYYSNEKLTTEAFELNQ